MKRSTTALLAFICGSDFRRSSQIVAKRQMASDSRIGLRKEMNLGAALPGMGIIEGAITPPFYPVGAMPVIAESFHDGSICIERGQAGNDGHQVQNGLGGDVRNRGRTDVVDV